MLTIEELKNQIDACIKYIQENYPNENNSSEKWITLIGEEFGELCMAINDGETSNTLEEGVQVCATTMLMLCDFINKNNQNIGDEGMAQVKDDFSKESKQGYKVLLIEKDRSGRAYALLSRPSGDFVVANGYDTRTGQWAAGDYLNSKSNALKTLKENIASKNRDSAVTDSKTFKVKVGDKHFLVNAKDEKEAIQKVVDSQNGDKK